jgi:predicted transcriptional regulator
MELVRSIRGRVQRLGHVMRMKEERVPKEALKEYIGGRRPQAA